MSISRKYGRTYHYGFSQGTTSDDRLNFDWYEDIQKLEQVVHTEKMDGENTCLNSIGVFARSHAAPTRHVWSEWLKPIQQSILSDLKSEELDIFGENMYAKHAIEYLDIEKHFYVFGMRKNGMWLSWEEVKFIADLFDMETAPELGIWTPSDYTKEDYQKGIEDIVSQPSTFRSIHAAGDEIGQPCTMEGLVTRNINEFPATDRGGINQNHVFKWVRKDHVKTDAHWSKNWQRAMLKWEREAIENGKKGN